MNKISNHWPIFLQFEGSSSKQNYPSKFNISWLDNEDFWKFVHDSWLSYQLDEFINLMDHLVYKLKFLKEAITGWIKSKKAKYREYFSILENQIKNIHKKNLDYSVFEEELLLIKDFEKENFDLEAGRKRLEAQK